MTLSPRRLWPIAGPGWWGGAEPAITGESTMSQIKLGKAEAKVLSDAAGEGVRIRLPDSIKPSTRERILGGLLRDGLIQSGQDGEHSLTPAGYRAVGLEPPRSAAGSKKALVAELLGRGEGASLAELTEATGWQPHTTRAALSRLRGGVLELAKSTRPDGTISYRLQPLQPEPTPEPAPKRRSRAKAFDEARAAA